MCVPGWRQQQQTLQNMIVEEQLIRPCKMYTEGDRLQALEMVHEGASLRQVEAATGVPKSTVMRMTKTCDAHTGKCHNAKNRPGTNWLGRLV